MRTNLLEPFSRVGEIGHIGTSGSESSLDSKIENTTHDMGLTKAPNGFLNEISLTFGIRNEKLRTCLSGVGQV